MNAAQNSFHKRHFTVLHVFCCLSFSQLEFRFLGLISGFIHSRNQTPLCLLICKLMWKLLFITKNQLNPTGSLTVLHSQLLRSRVQFFSRVCRSRLGGPCRQPRQSFLRGPRQPDHNLAETKQHVSPRNPPFRIHPADGAAQQKVRLEQK